MSQRTHSHPGGVKFPLLQNLQRWNGSKAIEHNRYGLRWRYTDLSFANFQNADVRSADFRKANLYGADFTGARLGVSPARSIWVVALALTGSVLVGLLSGWAGASVQARLSSGATEEKLLLSLLAALWASFVGMSWFWGFENTAKRLAPAFAIVFAVLILWVNVWDIGTGRGVMGVAFLLLSTSLLVMLGAFARALAGALWQAAFLGVAVVGGYTGGALGGGGFSLAIALAAALMGHRLLHRPDLHPHSVELLGEILGRLGTRFDDADLRNANFQNARLDGACFRGARVDEITWDGMRLAVFQKDPRQVVAAQVASRDDQA